MRGILMIGPREWGNDHYEYLKTHAVTSLQYSAQNIQDSQTRLRQLTKPFPLFIYTPKKYRNKPNGSQKVEFACRVIDYEISKTPISSPWPTVPGPKWYDKKKNFKYEFWFKVDFIQKCEIFVTDLDFYKSDGTKIRYKSLAEFSLPARGKILFFSSSFRFNDNSNSGYMESDDLLTEKITHGDVSSIPDEEGKKRVITHVAYERSPKNRKQAIKIHGTKCNICGFDFDSFYGSDLAQHYIEVHHIVPLNQEQRIVDPEKDLICVCSNCHSMLHRRGNELVSIEELKKRIINNQNRG